MASAIFVNRGTYPTEHRVKLHARCQYSRDAVNPALGCVAMTRNLCRMTRRRPASDEFTQRSGSHKTSGMIIRERRKHNQSHPRISWSRASGQNQRLCASRHNRHSSGSGIFTDRNTRPLTGDHGVRWTVASLTHSRKGGKLLLWLRTRIGTNGNRPLHCGRVPFA